MTTPNDGEIVFAKLPTEDFDYDSTIFRRKIFEGVDRIRCCACNSDWMLNIYMADHCQTETHAARLKEIEMNNDDILVRLQDAVECEKFVQQLPNDLWQNDVRATLVPYNYPPDSMLCMGSKARAAEKYYRYMYLTKLSLLTLVAWKAAIYATWCPTKCAWLNAIEFYHRGWKSHKNRETRHSNAVQIIVTCVSPFLEQPPRFHLDLDFPDDDTDGTAGSRKRMRDE